MSSRRRRDENIVWILKHLGDSKGLSLSGIQARTGINRVSVHRCLEKVAHYVDKVYPHTYRLNEEGKKRYQTIMEVINEGMAEGKKRYNDINTPQGQHKILSHVSEHELLQRIGITILDNSESARHLQRWRQQETQQKEQIIKEHNKVNSNVSQIPTPNSGPTHEFLQNSYENDSDKQGDPLSDLLAVQDDITKQGEEETGQEQSEGQTIAKRATKYDLIAQILHLGRRKNGVQITEAIDTVGIKHKTAKTIVDFLEEKGLARRFTPINNE